MRPICSISNLFSNAFLVIHILLTPRRQCEGPRKGGYKPLMQRPAKDDFTQRLSSVDAHFWHKSLTVNSNPVSWIQTFTGLFTKGSEP